MPHIIDRLLRSHAVVLAARVLLTLPFWASGMAKLVGFQSGVAEMAHFGLEPPMMFNIATIVVQLAGSLLIILNRYAWIGAGALAVFTALTIPIAHPFWSLAEEPFRTIAFHTAAEHVGMIGALIVVSILAANRNGRGVGHARSLPPSGGP